MADKNQSGGAANPHNLSRFVQAQEDDYEQALAEITSGRKRSHWMWYIFPQIDGLAFSATSKRYSIKSLAEAEAYLSHPVLGPRLVDCAMAALRVEGRSAYRDFRLPRRDEATVLRNLVRVCGARGVSVRPADREVFRRPA